MKKEQDGFSITPPCPTPAHMTVSILSQQRSW